VGVASAVAVPKRTTKASLPCWSVTFAGRQSLAGCGSLLRSDIELLLSCVGTVGKILSAASLDSQCGIRDSARIRKRPVYSQIPTAVKRERTEMRRGATAAETAGREAGRRRGGAGRLRLGPLLLRREGVAHPEGPARYDGIAAEDLRGG